MQLNNNLNLILANYPVGLDSTPFMITDLEIVRNNCKEFKKLFNNLNLYYAVKAYSAPELIKSIDDIVDGYDAASLTEIQALIGLGIDPSRILYSNPVKMVKSIAKSAEIGVNMFAAQSSQELDKIATNAPGSKIFIRIAMNDEHSKVPLGLKFGCLESDAIKLLQYAQQKKLKSYGLAFHVGSQQLDPMAWVNAIIKTQLLVESAKKVGIDLTYINIGGGFPAMYSKDDTPISLISVKVNESTRLAKIKYLAEPGRYIVANSSAIVSKVIGCEIRQGIPWVFLDVGLFQAFIGAKRFKPFPYSPVLFGKDALRKSGKDVLCVLTGPSCDSDDVILDDVLLPSAIEVGDIVVFPNSGAYTLVYGSRFNGFDPPPPYFKSISKA